jgi:methionyl-tRNA formyltransferase
VAAPEAIVSAVFGQKIPKRLLEDVEHRAWNLHPVLPGLPLEVTRGPAPFEMALGLGAQSMQWCLHQMTEAIDRGEEVARSVLFPLPREMEFTPESYLSVQQHIAPLAASLLGEHLRKELHGWREAALVDAQTPSACRGFELDASLAGEVMITRFSRNSTSSLQGEHFERRCECAANVRGPALAHGISGCNAEEPKFQNRR